MPNSNCIIKVHGGEFNDGAGTGQWPMAQTDDRWDICGTIGAKLGYNVPWHYSSPGYYETSWHFTTGTLAHRQQSSDFRAVKTFHYGVDKTNENWDLWHTEYVEDYH